METFENFNDSTSQYGVADDTSSMVSGYTDKVKEGVALNLETFSVSDNPPPPTSEVKLPANGEDFDGVLEDFKEEGQVDLPEHACRYFFSFHPSI
jgi:regulator of nonsense transcripts 1